MEVKPDYSVAIDFNYEGQDHRFLISPKYDRLDYFPSYGAWILKVIDSEHGFVTMAIDESMAGYIADASGIPVIEREFILESELEFWRGALEKSLDDSWLED